MIVLLFQMVSSDHQSSRQATEDGSIVVPVVSVPSSEAILRSLSPRGVHTVVVSDDPTAKSFCSKYCDEPVVVPDPSTDLHEYASALLALARREDVQTIVPVREEDAFVLSKHREAFADHVSTPWPTPETLDRVHDRVELAAAAESAGVPVPETAPLEAAELRDSPSIVKSRYNLLVDDYVDAVPAGETTQEKSVEHVRPGERVDVTDLQRQFGHEPIVQEFVPTDAEYMVGALCDHGEPVATFQHKQIRAPSYTGGGGVYRESTFLQELEEVAVALLDELDWHGLACLEYMRHRETGEFYLAEINPRMWTSLSANVQMGADFPYRYWQLATDRASEIDDTYEYGIGCHYLKGELMHVLSLLRDDSALVTRPPVAGTVAEILGSCYRHPNFDVFSRDDPWPFLQDFVTELDGAVPGSIDMPDLVRRASGTTRARHWSEAVDAPLPTVE